MPSTSSLIRELIDQALNRGILAIVDELVLVDGASHTPGWGISSNRLGLKQLIANLRVAFPDLHCAIYDEIERGSSSAALLTARGTHKGPFIGNMPTGRRIEVLGFVFAYIKNGQISEAWLLIDQMSILQQIGVVPPPSGSSEKDHILRRP